MQPEVSLRGACGGLRTILSPGGLEDGVERGW